MGVVNVFVGCELACLNVESHLFVCVAEWHSGCCKTVYFLYRAHRVVHRVVEYMLVHLYLVDVGSHLKTVLEFVKRRQEHFLDDLKVAEIAHREVVHYERYLLGQTLELV